MAFTGIIKKVTVITLKDLDDDVSNTRFLYGTVVSDRLQRFTKGDWFLSSKIIKIFEDKVETRNSVYLIEGEPDVVEMALNEFKFVRQGHEPSIAMKLANDDQFKLSNTAQNQLS